MSVEKPPVVPPRLGMPEWVIPTIYGVLTIIALWWSFSGIETSPERMARGWEQLGTFMRQMFIESDWNITPKVLVGLKESIQIALLGTALGALLAIPFGALAARNLSPFPAVPALGKTILNLIRTFPELILAIAFIKAVGPGAFAGVMAVGIHSIGMMGKLYSERIETVDRGAIEALTATGANGMEVFRHAILPEVLPDFLSLTLYRFDINVRAATVLGLVGAGGIGTLLDLQRKASNWHTIGVILIGIIITVALVDFTSSKLRERLA